MSCATHRNLSDLPKPGSWRSCMLAEKPAHFSVPAHLYTVLWACSSFMGNRNETNTIILDPSGLETLAALCGVVCVRVCMLLCASLCVCPAWGS